MHHSICSRCLCNSLTFLVLLGTGVWTAAGEMETAVRGARDVKWQPVGLSGGGGMFSPAISAADPNLMMLNCDMSAAYISVDGGRNWRMIHHAQLKSDTRCRPAFHPTDRSTIYASSGGRLRVSRDLGQTFQPIGNLRESLAGEIAICPTDPRVHAGRHTQWPLLCLA